MSVTFASVVLTSVAALVIYKMMTCYLRYKQWVAQYDSLPGNSGHWLFGHLKEHPGVKQDGIEYLYSFVKLYPKLHKLWFTRFHCSIVVHHPDSVKQVLKSHVTLAPKPLTMGTVYLPGLPWLGEGLLIANGQKWMRQRRLLTPGFHFDILHPYVKLYNESADVLLSKLDKFADSGKSFDMYDYIGLLTLDNMMKCTLSKTTDCQQRENHPYVVAMKKLANMWAERTIKPLYYSDFIYYNFTKTGREFRRLCDYVHEVADDIIKNRRQELEREAPSGRDTDPKSKHLDFLDILLKARDEDGEGLSDLEIRSEVDTFMFEGHDTTASGLSFTLMSLAQHPEIQKKVQQEIDCLLNGRSSDHIDWKELPKLEYLNRCIKESLRMNPPVYYFQRRLEEEIVVDDFRIPKGTDVDLNIRNLHHNPAVWGEDHWDFKPDRFLPEHVNSRDPFAYCPFSGGQRNCIGQNFAMNEMKVTVARILQRYSVELAPDFNQNQFMSIVMRPEDGIKMILKRRQ